MTTNLENEVRHALAVRAHSLPTGASARLRGVEYRPRVSRRAPTAGLLAGAATAGTVAAIVVGGGAPAAYAGWSATPTSASAPSPTATASCEDQLSAAGDGAQAAALGSGAWQNVLTDVRGPFTVALFQNDGAYAACFTGSSFTEVNQISSTGTAGGMSGSGSVSVHSQNGNAPAGGGPGSGGGFTSVGVSATSSGDLQSVVQTHLTTTADGPYTLVDGRAQDGVSAVTLVRDDGQTVVATVSDGWFVAWWPGSATGTSVHVTTASGTTSEPLVSNAKLGPGSCSPQPAAPAPSPAGSGPGSVCRSSGSAPADPGNTARGAGTGAGNSGTSSSGKPGDTGTGNSGTGNSGEAG